MEPLTNQCSSNSPLPDQQTRTSSIPFDPSTIPVNFDEDKLQDAVTKTVTKTMPTIGKLPQQTKLEAIINGQKTKAASQPYYQQKAIFLKEQRNTPFLDDLSKRVDIAAQLLIDLRGLLTHEVHYLGLLSRYLIKLITFTNAFSSKDTSNPENQNAQYYDTAVLPITVLPLHTTKAFSFFSRFLSCGLSTQTLHSKQPARPSISSFDLSCIIGERKTISPFALDANPCIAATAQSLLKSIQGITLINEMSPNQMDRQQWLIALEKEFRQSRIKRVIPHFAPAFCWFAKTDFDLWASIGKDIQETKTKEDPLKAYANKAAQFFIKLKQIQYFEKRKQLFKLARDQMTKSLGEDLLNANIKGISYLASIPNVKIPNPDGFNQLIDKITQHIGVLSQLIQKKNKKKASITKGIHPHPLFITNRQTKTINKTKQDIQTAKASFTYAPSKFSSPTTNDNKPQPAITPTKDLQTWVSFPPIIDRFLGSKELLHRFALQNEAGYGLVVQYKGTDTKPVRGLFCYRIKDGICLERFFTPMNDHWLLTESPQRIMGNILSNNNKNEFGNRIPMPIEKTESDKIFELQVDPHLGHVTIPLGQGKVIEVMTLRGEASKQG